MLGVDRDTLYMLLGGGEFFSKHDLEWEAKPPLFMFIETQPRSTVVSDECGETASLALGIEDSGVDTDCKGGVTDLNARG